MTIFRVPERGIGDHDVVVGLRSLKHLSAWVLRRHTTMDGCLRTSNVAHGQHVPTYIRVFAASAQHGFQLPSEITPWCSLTVIFYSASPVRFPSRDDDVLFIRYHRAIQISFAVDIETCRGLCAGTCRRRACCYDWEWERCGLKRCRGDLS